MPDYVEYPEVKAPNPGSIMLGHIETVEAYMLPAITAQAIACEPQEAKDILVETIAPHMKVLLAASGLLGCLQQALGNEEPLSWDDVKPLLIALSERVLEVQNLLIFVEEPEVDGEETPSDEATPVSER